MRAIRNFRFAVSGPVPARSGLGGPGDVFHRIVHESREARRHRRMLRSKLSSGSAGNNGTGGQRNSFWPANPVASIRWEEQLVSTARWSPVRTNRGLSGGGRTKRMMQVVPEKHPGCKRQKYFT